MIGTTLIIIGSLMLSCIGYAAAYALGYERAIKDAAEVAQAWADEQSRRIEVKPEMKGSGKGTFAIRNEQTNTILSTGN